MKNLKNYQLSLKFKKLAEDPWTDHIFYLAPFLELTSTSKVIEFGLGKGSEVFIDFCQHVQSIELVVEKDNLNWVEYCENKFAGASNWKSKKIICDELLLKAHSIAWRSHNPIEYLESYPLHLEKMINSLFFDVKCDLIFIDCGFAPRADILNKLFYRAPILVAHDTNQDEKMYGWLRLSVPEKYTEVHFDTLQGLTFWVEKSQQNIINFLRNLQKIKIYKDKRTW